MNVLQYTPLPRQTAGQNLVVFGTHQRITVCKAELFFKKIQRDAFKNADRLENDVRSITFPSPSQPLLSPSDSFHSPYPFTRIGGYRGGIVVDQCQDFALYEDGALLYPQCGWLYGGRGRYYGLRLACISCLCSGDVCAGYSRRYRRGNASVLHHMQVRDFL